jgi:hypothetical protein
LNCAVLGSLLLPLKPQRRKRLEEGVKLLDANVAGTTKACQVSNEHDLKALEQGQLDDRKINLIKQKKVFNNIFY